MGVQGKKQDHPLQHIQTEIQMSLNCYHCEREVDVEPEPSIHPGMKFKQHFSIKHLSKFI